MKCLIILSHLMSKECKLGIESVARCELAMNLFFEGKYKFILTSGWDYREDCSVPISEVVRSYILNKYNVEKKSVISLPFSRDTVGDAYYCLFFLQESQIKEIHVVSSDYHKSRVEYIFTKVFNGKAKIKVYGATTNANNDLAVLQHEKESINAFTKTFALTDFSSVKSIHKTLSEKHPFYNGDVYPKID